MPTPPIVSDVSTPAGASQPANTVPRKPSSSFAVLSNRALSNRLFAERRHDTHENVQAWEALLDAIDARDERALFAAQQQALGWLEPLSQTGTLRRSRLAKRVASLFVADPRMASLARIGFGTPLLDDAESPSEEVEPSEPPSTPLELTVCAALSSERLLTPSSIAWNLNPLLFAQSFALHVEYNLQNSAASFEPAISRIVGLNPFWGGTSTRIAHWMEPRNLRASPFDGLFGLPARAPWKEDNDTPVEERPATEEELQRRREFAHVEQQRDQVLSQVLLRSQQPGAKPLPTEAAFARAQETVFTLGLLEILEKQGRARLKDPSARADNKRLWTEEESALDLWARHLIERTLFSPERVPSGGSPSRPPASIPAPTTLSASSTPTTEALSSTPLPELPQKQIQHLLFQELNARAQRQGWGMEEWAHTTRCLLLGCERLMGYRGAPTALFSTLAALFWSHYPEALLPLRRDDSVRVSVLLSNEKHMQEVFTDERLARWLVHGEGTDQRPAHFVQSGQIQEWAPLSDGQDFLSLSPSFSQRQTPRQFLTWIDWAPWFGRTGVAVEAASFGLTLTPGLSHILSTAPEAAGANDFSGRVRRPFKGRDLDALRREIERVELQEVSYQAQQQQATTPPTEALRDRPIRRL